MKWDKVSVETLTKIVTKGTTPTSIGYQFVDDGIPFLRVNNIQGGGLDISDVLFINNETDAALKRSRILPNDVLISIAGTIGRSAVVPENAPSMNCNQAIAIIRLQESANPYYFRYWLNSQEAVNQISNSKVTATISNLSLGCINKLKISLPPLEEQKRIAAILDKADRVRRKRKEAIRLTEELGRSIFLDMFGDPVTNPKGWEIKKLRNVIQSIDAGWSANGEEKKCEEDEWGVLKVSAVTSGIFKPLEHKSVGRNPNFSKSPVIPKKGDLLFSRANTRELVAATCIVEQDYERIFLSDKLWRISVFENLITPEYLKFLLTYQRYRDLLTKQATGTSGSMLNISQGKLLDMNAPIPDIETQRKFSDLIWQSIQVSMRIQENSKESENLFNSLLQRAFRGEL